MGFHKRHVKMIYELIEEYGLRIILENKSEEFVDAVIYKYDYVPIPLQELRAWIGDKTDTVLNIWMSGKFFGYSDYEIGRLIKERKAQNDIFKELF